LGDFSRTVVVTAVTGKPSLMATAKVLLATTFGSSMWQKEHPTSR